MELKDRLANSELLARLMHALNQGDCDRFADFWINDVDSREPMFDRTKLSATSREALLNITKQVFMGNPSSLRHVVGPVELKRIDARFVGTFSSAAYYVVGEECRFVGRGEYTDQLSKFGDSKR